VQTLETELNFIALLSEYLYTTTWAQPKNIWSLDPLNTLQICFVKYLCVIVWTILCLGIQSYYHSTTPPFTILAIIK